MLTDQDIDKLATAVVVRQQRFLSPVLNTGEAESYIGKRSNSAFTSWCRKWRVPMCDDGRYSRRELDAGLKREARNRHARKARVSA